jgi:general secretion pathway protein N
VLLTWRRALPARNRWPGSAYAESTLAQAAWERTRRKAAHWAWAGLLCGALLALPAFAPAAWLADLVAARSAGRLLLVDARGTVWDGSAVPVLTGGPDSRSATMLPGRASWRLGWQGLAPLLHLRQPCCIDGELALQLRPGLDRWSVQLPAGPLGQWPVAWLTGLGAPWNTLQLGGTMRLTSNGLTLDVSGGRWQLAGQAELELSNVTSPLTTLERLGSYRLQLRAAGGQPPAFVLSTLDGDLLLDGAGQWAGTQWRFRGEARAAPGAEGELDNLLNFFGRRQGALSLLSIGSP